MAAETTTSIEKPKKKRNFIRLTRKKVIAGIAVLLCIALVSVYFFVGRKDNNAAAQEYVETKVIRDNITETIEQSGIIEPLERYEITSRVTGEIISSPFEEGDYVEEGDLLYQIDNEDAILNIEKAENNISKSKNNVEKSKSNVEKTENSIPKTENNIEKAENNVTKAKNSVTKAENNVTKAENNVIKAQNSITKAESSVAKAENNVVKAENNITKAQNNVTKARNSVEKAQNNVTKAQNNIEKAKNNIAKAQDDLDDINEEIAKLNIYASESGKISDLTVKKNDSIGVGIIAKIINTQVRTIDVPFFESDFGKINIGDTVTLTSALHMESISGTVVHKYDAAIDGGSKSSSQKNIEIEIKNPKTIDDNSTFAAVVHTKSGDVKSAGSGSVKAGESTSVKAEVSGTVTEVNVKNGDTVKKGQLLVKLKSDTLSDTKVDYERILDEYKIALSEAEIALKESQQSLEESKLSEKEAEMTLSENIIALDESKQSLEESKIGHSEAKATLAENELALDESKQSLEESRLSQSEAEMSLSESKLGLKDTEITLAENILSLRDSELSLQDSQLSMKSTQKALDDYNITSPISGTVIEKISKTGDNINNASGQTVMMVVADMSKVKFTINVDELDISEITLGMKAIVDADALPDEIFEAEVTNIASEGDSTGDGVTLFKVELTIDEPGELKSGMNVNANIIINEAQDVLLIPEDALMSVNGTSATVFVKTAEASKGSKQNSDAKKSEENVEKKSDNAPTDIETKTPSSGPQMPAGSEIRRVEVGISDGTSIEIVSGLSEGEIIIYKPSTADSQQGFPFGMMGGGMPGGMPGGNTRGGGMPGGGAPGGGGMR